MATAYLIYNPQAGRKEDQENVRLLEKQIQDTVRAIEIQKIRDYALFLSGLEKEDYIVLVGGDGTLNRFANDTRDVAYSGEILYFPNGTGNDFAKELGHSKGDNPFPITQYLQKLPTVEIQGKTYRFLNGVGYGIDGYCCEVGDERKKTAKKPVNYAQIAVQGLLFHYKPTRATVTVDGVAHTYEYVWCAPTMNGKYYGGGMMATPEQQRGSDHLSTMVYHCKSKIKTLAVFPSIFTGKHIQHTKMVDILTGQKITVEFDSPRAVQIDGETILGVSSYTAYSPMYAQNKTAEYAAAI